MSRIVDNQKVELASALSEVLPFARRLDACVGYFNLRGWKRIADSVKAMKNPVSEGPRVRLLIGMALAADQELQAELRKMWSQRAPEVPTLERATDLARRAVEKFANQLVWAAPSPSDELSLRELMEDLESGLVEIRFYSRELLHAKLYVVHQGEGPVRTWRGVVGSSNLTNAGLKGQGELNLEETDHQLTGELAEWFDTRWNDQFSVDVSQWLVEVLRQSWAAPEQPKPYLVHLKMAYELSQEARSGLATEIPPEFANVLLEYQANAVKVANKMLEQRGLVVIGDVVGLGKTMIGSAIAASQPGSTLVLCPRNLVSMWEGYFHRFDIPGRVVSLSMARRDLPEMRHYGLVVIDESHRLRNHKTKTWRAVKEYIERGDSQLLLMTATMYNAYYSDIAGQLALKLSFDESLGLRPQALIDTVGEIAVADKTNGELDTLSAFRQSSYNEDWQQLLGLFLIRRTRKFVEENFGEWRKSEERFVMKYPDGTEYSFPKRKAQPLTYAGGPDDPGDRLASPENFDAMADLTYARYRLGQYLKPEVTVHGPQLEELVADLKKSVNSHSGFIRTTALKRLTSSAHAFLLTLDRMLLRSYVLAHALEHGLPLPVGTLSNSAYEIDGTENDDEDFGDVEDAAVREVQDPPAFGGLVNSEEQWRALAAQTYDHLATKNPPGLRWANSEWFDTGALLEDVESDAEVMRKIIAEHGAWDPAADTKLTALAGFINGLPRGKKVLVFSEYKDTIDYVHTHLSNLVEGRVIEMVSGSSASPELIARRFAPLSNAELGGLPSGTEEIDVLLATDVLSEGQNLQDADTIINWDLPWTIIPMIQRAGRVDRVGQKAREIAVLSFMPQDGLEKVLALRKRLVERLRNSAQIFGAGDKFFPDDEIVDDSTICGLFDGTAELDLDEGDVDYPSFALGIWNVATDEDKRKILAMQDSRYSTMASNSSHSPGTLTYCVTSTGYNVLVSQVGAKSATLSPIAALRATSCSPDVVALERRQEFFAELESGLKHVFADGKENHFLAVNRGLRKRLYDALIKARDALEGEDALRNGIGHLVDALVASPILGAATPTVLSILKSSKNLSDGIEGIDHLLDMHKENKLFKPLVDNDGEVRLVCAMGFEAV